MVFNDCYEIFTDKGWKDFDGIIKKPKNLLYKVTLDDDTTFTATSGHFFYSYNKKIKVSEMKVGTEIDVFNGVKKIKNIKKDRIDYVYDIFNVKSEEHKFVIAGTQAITKNCDEFGFVPGNQAQDFWAANYPTIAASKSSRIVIISTPNGMFNIFHRIYTESENNKNSFKHKRISWEEVPGRDKEWAEEQKKNLGMQQFNQEFAVQFLGSTNTVIEPDVLKVLLNSTKKEILTDLNGRLKVWEKPREKADYILGCDPAKGIGEDNSIIQILRIDSTKPIKTEQVAVFMDNKTDIFSYTSIIHRLSIYYNNAYIMIENNGDGTAVVQKLWWDLENENLVNSGVKEKNLGIRSTTKTKPKAVVLMKKLIEDGSIILNDDNTVKELASYVEENGKTFGKNKKDDCVSALYWATYFLEMGILEDSYEFKKNNEDDVWGILSDIDIETEDWSWLNNSSMYE